MECVAGGWVLRAMALLSLPHLRQHIQIPRTKTSKDLLLLVALRARTRAGMASRTLMKGKVVGLVNYNSEMTSNMTTSFSNLISLTCFPDPAACLLASSHTC